MLLSPLPCVIVWGGTERLRGKGDSHDCFVENGEYEALERLVQQSSPTLRINHGQSYKRHALSPF